MLNLGIFMRFSRGEKSINPRCILSYHSIYEYMTLAA